MQILLLIFQEKIRCMEQDLKPGCLFFFFYTRCYNIQNHGQDQYHDRFCSSNSGKETELHMGLEPGFLAFHARILSTTRT